MGVAAVILTLTPMGIAGDACIEGSGAVLDGSRDAFDRVVDKSDLIVEAQVHSVKLTRDLRIVTLSEVQLSASRVIKGPGTLQQFMITNVSALESFTMAPGQRFILFLREPHRTNAQSKPPQVPYFDILKWPTLCIDEETVHVAREGKAYIPWLDGISTEKAVENIRSYLQRQAK